MKHLLVMAVAVFVLAGCAGVGERIVSDERRSISSGFIGCSPTEIAIVNTGNTTWTATCKGKVFYCTATPTAACKAQLE